jgi:hypothetical protein
VDDDSVEKHGMWPWDRKISGKIIDKLTEFGAKTIVFDIFFPTVGKNPSGDTILFKSIASSKRVISLLHCKLPVQETLMRGSGSMIKKKLTHSMKSPGLSNHHQASSAGGLTNFPLPLYLLFRLFMSLSLWATLLRQQTATEFTVECPC